MPESTPTTTDAGSNSSWINTPTRYVTSNGQRLAYRELGAGDCLPLVLLTHLGATLDEWDPHFVDALAHRRRVIAVDLPGVGSSSGRVPLTVAEMSQSARGFIAALGLTRIDLLGFSLGGFIAQQLTLDAPELVNRLVLTGTGPAGGRGIAHLTGAAYVYWDMLRGTVAQTDPKEFLFFPRTPGGKRAAADYLERLSERTTDRDTPIAFGAFHRQIRAISAWGKQRPQDLSRIQAPTLIGNGDHDRMVPTALSHDMHERIPHSQIVIYPNAGHGGVFQYADDFCARVIDHLDGPLTAGEGA